MPSSRTNTRDALKRLRRNEGADPDAQLSGYEDAAGAVRGLQGDQQSAWIKTPPFTEQIQELIRDLAVPRTTGYSYLEPIAVQEFRLLELYLEYTAQDAGDTGQLSIIPRVSRDDVGDNFFYTAVINPTLTTVSPTGEIATAFGSRNVFATELRLPAIANANVYRITLPWDVAPYSRIQFGVFDLAATTAGTLTVSFARSV